MSRPALCLVALLALAPVADATGTASTVRVPADDPKAPIAEGYRFKEPYAGEFKLWPRLDLRHSGVTVHDLTFPSPLPSDVPENNTVHAQYFAPQGAGPFPAVVVLDILQGNQLVARAEAMWLAQNGVAAVVVVLPYYNQRKPEGSKLRLVSTDLPRTLTGIRQGVLDCRAAVAWLASRPEVDAARLGMVGTSLGSFLTAITAANEPKLKRAAILLGGGGLVDAYYDHPKGTEVRKVLDAVGGKGLVKRLVAPVDPLTYAEQLKGKRLLLVAARGDEIVPPRAATALWEATGRPRIVWLDAGHITAALYTVSVMCEVRDHFRAK